MCKFHPKNYRERLRSILSRKWVYIAILKKITPLAMMLGGGGGGGGGLRRGYVIAISYS